MGQKTGDLKKKPTLLPDAVPTLHLGHQPPVHTPRSTQQVERRRLAFQAETIEREEELEKENKVTSIQDVEAQFYRHLHNSSFQPLHRPDGGIDFALTASIPHLFHCFMRNYIRERGDQRRLEEQQKAKKSKEAKAGAPEPAQERDLAQKRAKLQSLPSGSHKN